MAQVFEGQTTDGNSVVVDDFLGGEIDIAVGGTFDGAIVELQVLLKKAGGSNWIPVSENGEPCQWTEPLVKTLRVSEPCSLRLVVVEDTDGDDTNINAWI
jgi:hypothetical protein